MAEPLFQTRLLTVFSVLALLLAVIGTYDVLAYDVVLLVALAARYLPARRASHVEVLTALPRE